jgi:hypothetical protein
MHKPTVLALAIAVLLGLPTSTLAQAIGERDALARVNATIDMTCFPPPGPVGSEPGIGSAPPCIVPVGLDPKFVSPNPTGQAHLAVRPDDTTRVRIDLAGLAPGLVVTAWLGYYFPPGPTPDPIFDPIGVGLPPVAGVAVPLAATDAGFTEGLGREPNQFRVLGAGTASRASLVADLDFNPLKSGQGPLRNELSPVTQSSAPSSSGAAQPICCPAGTRQQPIGASFLRVFDPVTGLPSLEPDGRPRLLRSPVVAAVIAIVVHIDGTTHGISAGLPIPPRPGTSATVGDHYTLGLFDLRQFHLD